MDGMTEKGGPAELSERPQEAGGDNSAGGPPPQRFSAKRKLRTVSRLLNLDGTDDSFPMTYQGNVAGRHWWVSAVPGAPLNITFNNSFSWEGGPRQFDRAYKRSAHGNEIFALGRLNTTVYSSRP